MRRDLNDALIRALRPPVRGRLEVQDTRVPGLMLRVTSSGCMTWAVRASIPGGRRVRATIGRYPAIGLAEARRRALETLARIATGHDPVAEKRAAAKAALEAQRAAEARGPTVAEAWAEWTAVRERAWSAARAARAAWTLRTIVGPAFGGRPLREVTGPEWKALIVAAHRERGPAAAANLARVVSPFLNFATLMGWLPASPFARGEVGHLAPPSRPRERVLSDTEIRLVWRAAEGLGAKGRAFTRLLVLTGARRGEVAGITTDEISLEAGEWRLPAARSKNRQGRAIPLGALALAELNLVWPQGEAGEGVRLLGRSAAAPFSGFSRLKAAVDARAAALAAAEGMRPPEPWTWHDVRRTVRTGLSRLGVGFEAAEAAIGHVVAKTALAKAYDLHRFEDEARAALIAWQAHVAAVVGENLVSLAGRRARG